MDGRRDTCLTGRWLAIEGIVGAGKTTTASAVAELAGVEPSLERLDDHPLLDVYYSDPSRYAVETELIFMAIHVHQMRAALTRRHIVTDFAPAKNLVFARLHAIGDDLRLLEKADERLWRDLQPPDWTAVLDVPVEVCRERLVARGRPYEQGLTLDDLARLRRGYLKALDTLGATVARIELTGEENHRHVAEKVMEIASFERVAAIPGQPLD